MSQFHFFYGGPFSQWYRSNFEIDGVTYNCAEQYMMAMKATVFGDFETLTKIMSAKHPSEQKALGRLVKGFRYEVWDKLAKALVYRANIAKFTADPALKSYILGTGDFELVEASPTDRIWGIGLAEGHPDIEDRSKWQGTNYLGVVLMQVRDTLRG